MGQRTSLGARKTAPAAASSVERKSGTPSRPGKLEWSRALAQSIKVEERQTVPRRCEPRPSRNAELPAATYYSTHGQTVGSIYLDSGKANSQAERSAQRESSPPNPQSQRPGPADPQIAYRALPSAVLHQKYSRKQTAPTDHLGARYRQILSKHLRKTPDALDHPATTGPHDPPGPQGPLHQILAQSSNQSLRALINTTPSEEHILDGDPFHHQATTIALNFNKMTRTMAVGGGRDLRKQSHSQLSQFVDPQQGAEELRNAYYE